MFLVEEENSKLARSAVHLCAIAKNKKYLMDLDTLIDACELYVWNKIASNLVIQEFVSSYS